MPQQLYWVRWYIYIYYKYIYNYIIIYIILYMLWEATLQSFQQCYKCDMCTVWFVVSLSFINMTLKSWNILVMSCPLVQYQAYNHLVLRNSDYKPDIALVSWHNIYNICRVCIVHIIKPFYLKWLTKCNGFGVYKVHYIYLPWQ